MGIIADIRTQRLHRAKNASEQKYLLYDSFPEITDTELAETRQTWPSMDIGKKDLIWSRIYKKEHGFSPYMIGSWQTHLVRKALNPYPQLSSFENKALADLYFPEIPFPEAIVRRIGGVYYDGGMNSMTMEDALNRLLSESSFIIKPAFGTMQGQGVSKIRLEGDRESDSKKIVSSFVSSNSDFVVQKVLSQHPDVARLNPSSLNCCRVTTIYLNGKSGHSTILKFGKNGSNVDNWHSSYIAGVTADGCLKDTAFDCKLGKVTCSDSGFAFGGMKLPAYDLMVETVGRFHRKYFPNCGIVGWDVFIDADGAPRIIEANLTKPGVVAEQYASGTFFEPFCGAINDRVKSTFL